MNHRSALRLGTRASLLAVAQSRLVQQALRALDPGLAVEIVTVETRGDRDLSVPLSGVADPGFFSAELDVALREGRVDACVHSLKDLPLGARAGIRRAAVPARENPRDVVLFRPEVEALLAGGETLRIGSSSARRARLTGAFLGEALPRTGRGDAPRLDFCDLRGTVESRVARLRRPRGAPGALDAAVLALAGLARLWGDRDGHAALAPLLEGTRLMVLPLSACPAAPGQGALSVDCRDDDEPVADLLARLHHFPTARQVSRELALIAGQPESARGAFAATAVDHEHCGSLVFADGDRRRVHWRAPPRPRAARPWDGADWARAGHCRPVPGVSLAGAEALFLAHWRAMPRAARLPAGARLWVSGVASWRALARAGIWVEGCAENLGFAAITPTLGSPVLRLPPLSRWTALTRSDAVASWRGSGVGRVVASYEVGAPDDSATLGDIRRGMSGATHFFWGSAAQYRALREWLPGGSHHACGPGKTYEALRRDGPANLVPFPSRQEWRAWLG